MSLYVGEAVRIRAEAIDPDTESPLDPPPNSAEVLIWGPDKNPVRNPEDREHPDFPTDGQPKAMDFKDALGVFETFVHTDGAPWKAGRWTFRVKVTGEHYTNWEYGTFTLKA